MRWVMTLGLVALAARAAGCPVVGYAGNVNFDDPFQNDLIGPTAPNFPIVLQFPDETDYFFPLYSGRPVSDLDLLGMRCAALGDGRLVVSAWLENQGSSPVAPN